MKFKYTGPDDEITLREVTFEKGKAVDLSGNLGLAAKVSGLDYFKAAKPKARKDENTD